MKREFIGLNTYLYSFSLDDNERFEVYIKRLSQYGKTTQVFLNNKLGFELKLNKTL